MIKTIEFPFEKIKAKENKTKDELKNVGRF